jgi:hypothetical protein
MRSAPSQVSLSKNSCAGVTTARPGPQGAWQRRCRSRVRPAFLQRMAAQAACGYHSSGENARHRLGNRDAHLRTGRLRGPRSGGGFGLAPTGIKRIPAPGAPRSSRGTRPKSARGFPARGSLGPWGGEVRRLANARRFTRGRFGRSRIGRLRVAHAPPGAQENLPLMRPCPPDASAVRQPPDCELHREVATQEP